MQWLTLTKKEAAIITGNWQNLPSKEFEMLVSSWSSSIKRNLNSEYLDLRNKVFDAWKKAKEKSTNVGSKKDYFTDLIFALSLYAILDEFGFNPRLASNDQVWIYLCVKVFPDIVHERHKRKDDTKVFNVKEDRFWKSKRRIYLKTLWWYIYLSLQLDKNGREDLVLTYKTLEKNTTDEVSQLVERAGSAGYRVDVCRTLMRYYYLNRRKYDNKTFRKVMVLNTARAKVVEPFLVHEEDGIETYVKELFDYLDRK